MHSKYLHEFNCHKKGLLAYLSCCNIQGMVPAGHFHLSRYSRALKSFLCACGLHMTARRQLQRTRVSDRSYSGMDPSMLWIKWYFPQWHSFCIALRDIFFRGVFPCFNQIEWRFWSTEWKILGGITVGHVDLNPVCSRNIGFFSKLW